MLVFVTATLLAGCEQQSQVQSVAPPPPPVTVAPR
jgi:uncharacterized lipoprotein YajG